MANNKFEILEQLLKNIEANFPNKNIENPSISKANIGWQLDHTLKVFNAVSEWTEKSNPDDYKKNFNIWRSLLFRLKYIPRGKAKAPKKVLPLETITIENLNTQLQIAKTHVTNLKSLPKNSYFKHHVFGMLTKKQTLLFLEMHTNHHLKIIKDILK
ncbi:DUF1569 domain-containing protein [uncultured Algibacter sp.]|uniref:DUF1569 domain-containing protein n=1 Tax=uncultured Algibacter sp. TaxID=298659 RepID=UPI002621FA94|nr:DUF1569 domain-containing protein [uncultured Algibacter sp.]